MGDANPHHWAFKVFKAYKSGGPGLIKINAGTCEFYAFEEAQDGLSLYYLGVRDNGRQYWLFSPSRDDLRRRRSGEDFWGWQIVQEFHARRSSEPSRMEAKEWTCDRCTLKNPGYRDDCELCHSRKIDEAFEYKGQKDDEDSFLPPHLQLQNVLLSFNLKRVHVMQDSYAAFHAIADQENFLTGKQGETFAQLKQLLFVTLETRKEELQKLYPHAQPETIRIKLATGPWTGGLSEIIAIVLARAFCRDLYIYTLRGQQAYRYMDSDRKEGAWHIVIGDNLCDSTRPVQPKLVASGATGSYMLAPPRPFQLPFHPGMPSKDSILALLPPKSLVKSPAKTG